MEPKVGKFVTTGYGTQYLRGMFFLFFYQKHSLLDPTFVLDSTAQILSKR